MNDHEVDIDLTLRAANKLTDFLDESLEKPFERYMVARFVSILYEETRDYLLEPEFESNSDSLRGENLSSLMATEALFSMKYAW